MANEVPIKNTQDTNKSGMTNEEIAKMISNAVAEALKVAIPAAAVGINAANAEAANKSREQLVREATRRTLRCPVCLLPQSACGGPFAKDKEGKDMVVKDNEGNVKFAPEVNHVRFYCGPKEESLFKWFQGVIINGTRFLADYYGHLQWIPKKCDIPTIIGGWEKNEKELSQKRQAEGHRMLPNGQVVATSNELGWR